MDETDTNLRNSTLQTLAFLASPAKQREFASTVHYADYVGEFSCWWFDSFIPDNELTPLRYSPREFEILSDFSSKFDGNRKLLPDVSRTIDALLGDPVWVQIVADAEHAKTALSSHA